MSVLERVPATTRGRLTTLAVAAVVWLVAYWANGRVWDRLLDQVIGLDPDARLTQSPRFFLYDTVKIDREFPDFDTPESHLHEQELLSMLEKALDELPERERLILTLYYYEELTLKEISGILGVSESRVSQIHSRSIEKMRKSLRSYINN